MRSCQRQYSKAGASPPLKPSPLHLTPVAVAQIGELRWIVPAGAEIALPGLLLMPDGAQFPDAIGAAMGRGEGEFLEIRIAGIPREGGFPDLVLVAPAADQEEIELCAAAMQNDEAELACEIHLRAGGRPGNEGAGEAADLGRHGHIGQRDVIPFEPGA